MPKPKLFQPPPSRRKQVETGLCTAEQIMNHPNFERGFGDIRAGLPFDDRVDDRFWAYEKGRLLGAIAPKTMGLFDDSMWRLNPKAVALFKAATLKGLIP
jgi:hypothetical protein